MQKLSQIQQVLVVLLLALGGAWLCLSIAPSLIAYRGGDAALGVVLKDIAPLFGVAALGVAFALMAISRVSGSAQPDIPAVTPVSYAGRSLKNLGIWIVVALVLVFFFNVFQGDGSGRGQGNIISAQNDQFIKLIPIILMAGFWMLLMWRARAKNKDKP